MSAPCAPEWTSAARSAQRGVKAVVEADLDAPPGPLVRRRAAPRPAPCPAPPGFSTRTWLPASSARCASGASWSWVVATTTTSGLQRQQRVEVRAGAPAVRRPPAPRPVPTGSVAPSTSSAGPERPARLWPISPHPAMPTVSRAGSDAAAERRRSRILAGVRSDELEVERELGRAGRRHRLARIGGVAGVDEQEASAAGARRACRRSRRCAAPACRARRSARWPCPGERLRLLSQCSCISSA